MNFSYKVFNTEICKMGLVWRKEKNESKIVEVILSPCRDKIKKNYPNISYGKDRLIEKVIKDIKASLKDKNVNFNLDVCDLKKLNNFQKKVLLLTAKVPKGRVTTYGDIARKLKLPKSARAVGQALAKSPFPIIIPCHRVVKRDGKIGGFSGGVNLKRKLLRQEGITLANLNPRVFLLTKKSL